MSTPKTISTKAKSYKQRFRNKWLENELFCDWLAAVEEDPYSAHCKACDCFLKAKLADLIMHRKSKKHSNCIAVFKPSLENHKSVHYSTPDYIKMVDDDIEENDNQLRLSDSENFDESTEVQENSSNNDTPGSLSKRYSKKRMSQGNKIHKLNYGSESISKIRKRKSNPHEDPELNAIYHKLGYIPYDEPDEDELTAFGKSIIAQMRKLPEERTIRLTAEIQSLVMKARIEHLEEKKAKENAAQNPHDITFSYETVNNTDLQPGQITSTNNYCRRL